MVATRFLHVLILFDGLVATFRAVRAVSCINDINIIVGHDHATTHSHARSIGTAESLNYVSKWKALAVVLYLWGRMRMHQKPVTGVVTTGEGITRVRSVIRTTSHIFFLKYLL